jgi:uncharacterized protein (DUF2252 family)
MRRAAVLVLTLAGCSAPTDREPRSAWLQQTLVDDNRPWLEREPDQVAGKLKKMSLSAHDYLRGSAAQFWRDVADPTGPVDASTAFGDGDGAQVWVVGDPHVENVGTFRAADGTMLVDWNDLDAAGRGPWWDDLRRLAVSLRVALPGEDGLVETMVTAYAAQIAAGGGFGLHGDGDPIAAELLAKAQEDGDAHEELTDFVEDHRFRHGELGFETTLTGVPAREQAMVEAAVARWDNDAPRFILDVARRYGAGVASYPLLRYYVLLDGDRMIEVRECGDGLRIPSLPRFPDTIETSPAARVVASQRALGERPDADPLLGWADVAPLSFKLRDRAAYQRGLALDDLADADPADLPALAADLGRLLARAHGSAVIAPVIAGRTDALVAETVRFADDYAALVEADRGRLHVLLSEEGPLLGFAP